MATGGDEGGGGGGEEALDSTSMAGGEGAMMTLTEGGVNSLSGTYAQ